MVPAPVEQVVARVEGNNIYWKTVYIGPKLEYKMDSTTFPQLVKALQHHLSTRQIGTVSEDEYDTPSNQHY